MPSSACRHLAKWLASEPKLAAVNGKSSSDVVSGAGFTVMVTVAVLAESALESLTTSVKVYVAAVLTLGAVKVGSAAVLLDNVIPDPAGTVQA